MQSRECLPLHTKTMYNGNNAAVCRFLFILIYHFQDRSETKPSEKDPSHLSYISGLEINKIFTERRAKGQKKY